MTEDNAAPSGEVWLPGGWLRNAEEMIACAALVVVVLATSWGVFTRYISAQPATWSAEIAAVGFCWAIFLGSAAAFKRGQHVSIDMLTGLFPTGLRRVVGAATDLLTFGFLGWVAWLAVDFTIESWTTPMPSLRWPYSIHYAGAALGLALMTLRHGRAAWARLVAG
jgi:TRAP-type C4-dicarboxylate transport system permease small subunit